MRTKLTKPPPKTCRRLNPGRACACLAMDGGVPLAEVAEVADRLIEAQALWRPS